MTQSDSCQSFSSTQRANLSVCSPSSRIKQETKTKGQTDKGPGSNRSTRTLAVPGLAVDSCSVRISEKLAWMGAKTWITLKDSTLRAGSTTTALEAARTAGHTHRALPLPGSTEGLRAAHQGSAHKLKSSTTASCPNPATLLLRYPSINPYSLPYLLPSKLPAHPPFSLLKVPRTAQSTSPECSEEPAALLQAQFGSPFARSSRVLPMKMSHIKAFLTQHRNKLYTQIKPSLSQNVEKYTVIAEYVVCWL